MSLVFRVNVGPVHILDEDLVNKVFEFDEGGKDLNKTADLSTFEKQCDEKSQFPTHFWLPDKDI